MPKKRLALLTIVLVLAVLIWQLPTLLKAIPSRYVAAYLPESLQSVAERDHVEILPTVSAPIDMEALLAQRELTVEIDREPTSRARPPQVLATEVHSTTVPMETPPVEQIAEPTTPPTSQPTPTPTRELPPAPSMARLGPLVHHFQTWNNCGPATLAMALSYFGVFHDQEQTASVLKPDPEDRNVSPYEIEDYVNEQTELSAVSLANGNLDVLKRLLAGGYPVIVELGLDPPGEYRWMGWYGHYLLVVAYDDNDGQVWVYDSWFGTSEVPGENANPDGRMIPYDELDAYWRQFSRNYIVLFESSQRSAVAEIIGPQMDDMVMWRSALERAQEELSLEQNSAFLWFNLGTAYNALGDYENAAMAFDQARALGLPWRMLWYQFGPYEAYYKVGRYEDVILLADVTLMDRPYFEESYYYRGLAMAAIGDFKQAQSDLEKAVKRNPNYFPAAEALAQLNT